VGPAAILVAGKVTWHKPTNEAGNKAIAANAIGGMVTWPHLPPMPMAAW
jgi:hypothetical protein